MIKFYFPKKKKKKKKKNSWKLKKKRNDLKKNEIPQPDVYSTD